MDNNINFRDWLLNENNAKTKLAIFDFDKTLAHTPEPPQGWKSPPVGPKNKKYDWWSHPNSLQNPVYDGELNPKIVAEFKKAKSDPNTHAALVTGRVGMRVAPIIRGHLQGQDLYGKRMIGPAHNKAINRQQQDDPLHPHEDHHDSHEEYYKNDYQKEPDYPKNHKGNPSSDTLDHKRYITSRLMHDGIQEIDFWDDRDNHRQHFLEMFEKYFNQWPNLQTVKFYHVDHDNDQLHQYVMNRNSGWKTSSNILSA